MARAAYICCKAPQTARVWQAGDGQLDNDGGVGTSGDIREGRRWRTARGQCGWLRDAVCAERAVDAGDGQPLLVVGWPPPAATDESDEPASPGFRHVRWRAQPVPVDTDHCAGVERVPYHHAHQWWAEADHHGKRQSHGWRHSRLLLPPLPCSPHQFQVAYVNQSQALAASFVTDKNSCKQNSWTTGWNIGTTAFTKRLITGHEPQEWFNTKTDRQTDRQTDKWNVSLALCHY